MALWCFSTADVPVDRRVRLIREHVAALVDMNVHPLGHDVPEAEGRIHLLPAVGMAQISGTEHRLVRTPEQALDGNDGLTMVLPLQGACHAQHRGGTDVCMHDGEAYLVSNDRPGQLDTAPACQHLVFSRPMLEPLLPELDGVIQRPLPATPELQLLSDYAAALLRQSEPVQPDTAELAASHLRDLAVFALRRAAGISRTPQQNGVRAMRLQALKADIVENLHRRMTPEAMARRHGISPRYLRALFADEGASFSRFVREQRLVRAYALLTDQRQRCRSISSVALDSGFSDLSYFNRCFRLRYGCTPSQARSQAEQ